MIKCNCNDPKCTTQAWIQRDTGTHATLVVSRKENDRTNEIMMYLTPNDLVQLIHDAKKALAEIIDGGRNDT
jgi:hypothetical protein